MKRRFRICPCERWFKNVCYLGYILEEFDPREKQWDVYKRSIKHPPEFFFSKNAVRVFVLHLSQPPEKIML